MHMIKWLKLQKGRGVKFVRQTEHPTDKDSPPTPTHILNSSIPFGGKSNYQSIPFGGKFNNSSIPFQGESINSSIPFGLLAVPEFPE